MALTLVPINNQASYKRAKALYKQAFPIHERMPLGYSYRKRQHANVIFSDIFDGDLWLGFCFMLENSEIVYIQYLAIHPAHQSKGYGGKFFDLIKATYPTQNILLLTEVLHASAKNLLDRKRRKAFYIKNGFHDTGRTWGKGSMAFELMLYGKDFQIASFIESMAGFFGWVGRLLKPFVYRALK